MIFYYMLRSTPPWSGLSGVDAATKAAVDGERPLIPRDVDARLSTLLKRCWDENPNGRPSFEEIIKSFSIYSRKCFALYVFHWWFAAYLYIFWHLLTHHYLRTTSTKMIWQCLLSNALLSSTKYYLTQIQTTCSKQTINKSHWLYRIRDVGVLFHKNN